MLLFHFNFHHLFYLLVASWDPDHQRDKREITQNSSEDKSIWENILLDNL